MIITKHKHQFHPVSEPYVLFVLKDMCPHPGAHLKIPIHPVAAGFSLRKLIISITVPIKKPRIKKNKTGSRNKNILFE